MLFTDIFTKLSVLLVTSHSAERLRDENAGSMRAKPTFSEENKMRAEKIARDIRLTSWTIRPF